MKKIVLGLSRKEQLKELLKVTGWFEGRCTDISKFELICEEEDIKIFESAKKFLREFSGIKNVVYLSYDKDDTRCLYDFTFDFDIATLCEKSNFNKKYLRQQKRPTLWKEYEEKGEDFDDYKDFEAIEQFAKEDCICVGLFGYYYAGIMAIGQSGKLYVKHDYGDLVEVFDNILDAMESELRCHTELVAVSSNQE